MIFPFSICLAERIVTTILCCSAKCYMSQATNPTHPQYKNIIIIKPCSTMQCYARLSFTVVYSSGRSGSEGVSVRGHDGAPGQSWWWWRKIWRWCSLSWPNSRRFGSGWQAFGWCCKTWPPWRPSWIPWIK